MKDYKTIVSADDGPVRSILLNRPERRNAMTPEMQLELIAALEDTTASDCRVLVLSGAGETFCAGLDLSSLQEVHDKTSIEYRADAERIARLFLALYELPIPTIAVVDGAAIAGGTGLAIVCDFTLATPRARFGFTEVRIGFVPALVSAFLALQLGHKRSMDLLLTGRIFDAYEAHRLGLVNEIVQAGEMAERVKGLADTLIANSGVAMSATKRMVAAQNRAWLSTAIVQGIDVSMQSRMTPDFREGITAFFEKRKPVWPK